MFVAPAAGVPHELMLQDTLKSAIVSFSALFAGMVFFWHQRDRTEAMDWHPVMWLPLSLMLYALGSMVWSHTYLGGVEAVRWFVFSLLVWLGVISLQGERLPMLVGGIHAGAVVASVWAALQFWIDFRFFPQGGNPASTFVNRNFFAEYLICTLPFSVWLLARARSTPLIAVLSFTLSFNVVALMMTGTRSALAALWLLALVVMPVVLTLYRKQFAFTTWSRAQKVLAVGGFAVTLAVLGQINSGNPSIINSALKAEVNAFERAFKRTAAISIKDNSLSDRFVMWNATLRIIKDHPLAGVGAGAWEVEVPLYQLEGVQLETDYYAHNEILQLLAEYGLLGWVFFLSLISYLANAAWKTLRNRTPEGQAEAPIRAMALSSLLALMVVSNAGFPWRLAMTGALFALCLGMLAASDVRISKGKGVVAEGGKAGHRRFQLPWRPALSSAALAVVLASTVLATYIAQQAAAAERKLVDAVKYAIMISGTGRPNDPRWNPIKDEILALMREGIAINPHYRKLTPMTADEFARWGDWKNAVWIWESVVASRPYVVAIISNIARGYAQMGDMPKAFELLERCKQIQPKAPAVRYLEIVLLGRTGKEAEALALARQSLNDNIYDLELVNAVWAMGLRGGDYDLAIRAMELRNQKWPAGRVDGLLKLGNLYAAQKKDDARALAAFRAALAAAPPSAIATTRERVPAEFLARL